MCVKYRLIGKISNHRNIGNNKEKCLIVKPILHPIESNQFLDDVSIKNQICRQSIMI